MRSISDIVTGLAAVQHGRVARTQLLAAGFDASRVARWLAGGRLLRVHQGVYAVGHVAPSWRADCMAAVLAGGEGAVLSHRAAAHLLGLLRGPPPPPEVTVPTTAGRGRPGVRIHRVAELHALDVAVVDHIPVTIVPRVLLDCAPATAPEDLARMCHEAWIHHRTTPAFVAACIARNPCKPGAGKLRRALGADVTLSELERGFLRLLRRHGLALPRTNIDRHGDKVDCHWPAPAGVTIELHSFRFHATRAAFEADIARRRRSNHVAYTYGDVFERGAQTAADVAVLLKRPQARRAS
jgi:hypothetical protein